MMEEKCDLKAPHEEIHIAGVKFDIEGLHCANCAAKIEKKLNHTAGIEEAVLNFSTMKIIARSDLDKKELQKLVQTVVDSIEDGVTITYKQEKQKTKLISFQNNWNLMVGVPLYALGLIAGFPAVVLVSYLVIGFKVLRAAIRNIIRKDFFEENFLMTIATIGAIAIGEYNEAVGVMLFYSVGELFQDYAVDKSRESIGGLMDLRTETATVRVGNELIETGVEEIPIGSILVVKVGQKIPLDGIVVAGTSMLNTANLTGESLPVDIKEGEEVLSGTVNLTAVLEIRTTKIYEDSTVAKIIELLEESASRKAPIEKFVTRFSRRYTPTVIALAMIVAFVFPILFGGGFETWIYRALVFLVVSCPCSIVVSVPLTLYAGIGKASKIGALVKGSNYLEQVSKIKTIVMDKTGTITKGEFEVKKVNGDVLEPIAYGEALSHHPVGLSILKEYGKTIDQSRIADFEEIAGKGIKVKFDGDNLIVGKYEFLQENGVELDRIQSLDTVIYLAKNGIYQGSVEIGDDLKENSQKAIEELNGLGLETVMLTGDNRLVAQHYSEMLGIDKVYADLMPEDKVAKIEELLSPDYRVAFVGDGINDGPVLMRSDIGISMGNKASDLAKQAADIVLIHDDLSAIVDLIKVSLKTNRILVQNIVFSIMVKVLIIILATLGIANMWIGVFGDVGVALLTIINSLRAMR